MLLLLLQLVPLDRSRARGRVTTAPPRVVPPPKANVLDATNKTNKMGDVAHVSRKNVPMSAMRRGSGGGTYPPRYGGEGVCVGLRLEAKRAGLPEGTGAKMAIQNQSVDWSCCRSRAIKVLWSASLVSLLQTG